MAERDPLFLLPHTPRQAVKKRPFNDSLGDANRNVHQESHGYGFKACELWQAGEHDAVLEKRFRGEVVIEEKFDDLATKDDVPFEVWLTALKEALYNLLAHLQEERADKSATAKFSAEDIENSEDEFEAMYQKGWLIGEAEEDFFDRMASKNGVWE